MRLTAAARLLWPAHQQLHLLRRHHRLRPSLSSPFCRLPPLTSTASVTCGQLMVVAVSAWFGEWRWQQRRSTNLSASAPLPAAFVGLSFRVLRSPSAFFTFFPPFALAAARVRGYVGLGEWGATTLATATIQDTHLRQPWCRGG